MISVIIPAYNEEKYIENCISSIKNSSFKDYEIVVVANGCTDNTYNLIKDITEKSLNLKEKGVSLAKNNGAKIAKGDWLLFLDADSKINNNLLHEINKLNPSFIGGSCKTHPDNKKLFEKTLWHIINLTSFFTKTPNGTSFIRKDIFNKIKGYNENIRIGEDTELIKKAAKHGKIKIITDSHILTSMRRFEKNGYIKTLSSWIFAFFKPNNKDYEDFR